MWNLLCQYNNIYTSLHKYLKEKKRKKKEKEKVAHQNDTVDEQCKNTEWTLLKYCSGIAAFHKTFIFNCGWSQFYILLFYFDL